MVVMLLCGYVCVLVEILCFMVGWFEGMLCCWIEDWIEEVFVKNKDLIFGCICISNNIKKNLIRIIIN